MEEEDLRGFCNRPCIYCDNGRCDMFNSSERDELLNVFDEAMDDLLQ